MIKEFTNKDYRAAGALVAKARNDYEQALARLVVIERSLKEQGAPTLSIRFTDKYLFPAR
jgi:hypothetical protein